MSGKPHTVTAAAWCALWSQRNRRDGCNENICCRRGVPLLFSTRKDAREWISVGYGYISRRPDLRAEPFGWRMPRAVRVTVTVD